MANGPCNYTHSKINKPILKTDLIERICWISCKPTNIPNFKKRKLCNEKCEIIALKGYETHQFTKYYRYNRLLLTREKLDKWVSYHQNFDDNLYDISEKMIDRMVYISGMGGYSSMAYYNNRWWSVYGVCKRTKNKKKSNVYVLHNIPEPFDETAVNSLRDKIKEIFETKEMENG